MSDSSAGICGTFCIHITLMSKKNYVKAPRNFCRTGPIIGFKSGPGLNVLTMETVAVYFSTSLYSE